MRVRTSVTISRDLLRAIDKLAGQRKNRSEFIEAALRNYIAQLLRQQQNARDLEIINRRADDLNEEAMDVPGHQVSL
jgi:metal-responsive CopG/Arc/MetJ family transcriptional regulator